LLKAIASGKALFQKLRTATLPNCGKLLKANLPSLIGNMEMVEINKLQYGKNSLYVTMDNPQPSS
jgi:hypothetical protein